MDEKVARDDQADGEGEDAIDEADRLAGHSRVNCNARDNCSARSRYLRCSGPAVRPGVRIDVLRATSCFETPLLVCVLLYDTLHVATSAKPSIATADETRTAVPRGLHPEARRFWMIGSEPTIQLRHHAVTREGPGPPPDHFGKWIPYASDRPAGSRPQAVPVFRRGAQPVDLALVYAPSYTVRRDLR